MIMLGSKKGGGQNESNLSNSVSKASETHIFFMIFRGFKHFLVLGPGGEKFWTCLSDSVRYQVCHVLSSLPFYRVKLLCYMMTLAFTL